MRPRNDRGTVLVLTASTVVVVTLLVASLSFVTAVNFRTAENNVADLANRQAALSAIEIVKALRPGQSESDNEGEKTKAFTYTIGETRIEIRFLDEESKINVNGLVDSRDRVDAETRERLEKLFALFAEDGERMVERLVDYIDSDTKGIYEIRAKNAPLDTIEELLFIEGITSEVFFGDATDGKPGLRDCLTIESSGMININTAPVPVLCSLSYNVDEKIANAIIAAREQKPFKQIHELVEREIIDQQTYNSISKGLSTTGSHYHAYITAQTGTAKKTYELLLSGRGDTARVLYIRELHR